MLLMALFLAAVTPATNPVDKDVAVTVAPGHALDGGGQPTFTVRFTNLTEDYVNLYDPDAYWNWTMRLTRTGGGDEEAGPWRVRLHSIPLRHPVTPRQLLAGKGTEVTVDLNDPPFTFEYVYEGVRDRPAGVVRRLKAGKYKLEVEVRMGNPFGAGYHFWTGPVRAEPVEIVVGGKSEAAPTAEQVAGYDAAIARVGKILAGPLWMNGITPDIRLPGDAGAEDVVDAAVNVYGLGSKAYEVLSVRKVEGVNGLDGNVTAAVVRVGKATKVLVFFPRGDGGWWTRFYEGS